MAEGGPVEGQGGPREDNQLRRLSVGEFVVKTKSAKQIGLKNLVHMNKTGTIPLGEDGKPSKTIDWKALRGGWFQDGWKKLSGEAKKWADEGIAKVLGALWDGTVGTYINNLKNSGSWGKELIGAIMDKLKGYVTAWGTKRDEQAAELKKKYEAEQAKSEEGGGFNTTGTKKAFGSGKEGSRAAGRHFTGNSGGTYAGHQPSMNKALDFMVSGGAAVKVGSEGYKAGSALAENFRANMDKYTMIYIIWYRKILRNYAHSGTKKGAWSTYFDAHGGTPGREHTNHVHASYLASGGLVRAKHGGIMSVIGEAGRDERVEPLDRQGLSTRDRALIQSIVAQMSGRQGTGGGSATVVRVYIGNEELKDIVRYEISDGESTLAKALSTGRRGP
jgi:hypothetical protein